MFFLFLISLFIYFYFISYLYFYLDYRITIFLKCFFFLLLIIVGFIYFEDFLSLFTSKYYSNNIVLNIFLFILIVFFLYWVFSLFVKSFFYAFKNSILCTFSDFQDGCISFTTFLLHLIFYFLIILFAIFILYSVASVLVGALVSIKSSLISCFSSCSGGRNRTPPSEAYRAPVSRFVNREEFEKNHVCYKGCTDGGPGEFQHQRLYDDDAPIALYLCVKCRGRRMHCNCWSCKRCDRPI